MTVTVTTDGAIPHGWLPLLTETIDAVERFTATVNELAEDDRRGRPMSADERPTFGDEEIRDAIRDLCLAVAEVAVGVVHVIGTNGVQSVLNKAERLSALMDREDDR